MSARTTGQNVYHDPRMAFERNHYARPPGVGDDAADFLIPEHTLVAYRRGTTGNLAERGSARPDLIPLGINMSLSVDVAPTSNTSTPIVTQTGLVGGLDNSAAAPVTEADYLATVYMEDNFTIRRDNGDTGDGPVYSALGIYMGVREDPESGEEMHMVWIPEIPASVLSEGSTSDQTSLMLRAVRGACGTNVADLTAFDVDSGTYGVTFTENDIVLLMAQTSGDEKGPWVVGPVDAGIAPLARPAWWPPGATIPTGTMLQLQEGYGGTAGLTLYVATAGGIEVDADDPGFAVLAQDRDLFTVRGIVDANVADLTAFAVSGAGRDGLTYTEGQLTALVAQSTAAQGGPYVVGPVNTTAPLIRPVWWMTGMVLRAKSSLRVDAGTVWSGKEWFASLAGDITVGTSAPAFYPRTHDATTPTATGTPGIATISTLWMLSSAIVTYSRATTGGTPGHVSITTQTAGDGDGVLALTSTANETSTFNVHVQNG